MRYNYSILIKYNIMYIKSKKKIKYMQILLKVYPPLLGGHLATLQQLYYFVAPNKNNVFYVREKKGLCRHLESIAD